MATSSTGCSWQKAPSAAMPSGLLANEPVAPCWPTRASRDLEAISTPQMILVTVTCLVCAIESLATVRSCVTWAAVPGLRIGRSDQRAYGSRPHAGEPMPRFPHYDILELSLHSQIQGPPGPQTLRQTLNCR